MEETEENISTGELSQSDSPTFYKVKPKKRSLVERELETNLTERVTSPITNGSVSSTSRYGRARRLKTSSDFCDSDKAITNLLKSPNLQTYSPKAQSPAYKMHAFNSPIKTESPKQVADESDLKNKIKSIYNENISLRHFAEEENMNAVSPTKKNNKIYVRKDLIQNQEKEETLSLIRNMFSPTKQANKSSHLKNILERSSEKYSLPVNGTTAPNSSGKKKSQNKHNNKNSVVKILDFDNSRKRKRDSKEGGDKMKLMSKSELFDMEAKCEYQVGDLAWARMGTFPYWPCIVTREPFTQLFVKKKMFGRVERDIIHVTFFGDNGRRGWIVDNMLRNYLGELEFEHAREQLTPEAKRKDPKLYASFIISEKKMPYWKQSIEEAEQLLREPKRLRIDILNNMLQNYGLSLKHHRSEKVSRTNSDVSLSESLYDTLFSEDDGKNDDTTERTRNKSKNKALDVSEVVTACLDNMAAKTGITKIQRQSHMDRWLQKAKSKTPEKPKEIGNTPNCVNTEKQKTQKRLKSKKTSNKTQKPYSCQNSVETKSKVNTLLAHQNEHDYSASVQVTTDNEYDPSSDDSSLKPENVLNGAISSDCFNGVTDSTETQHTSNAVLSDLVADSLKSNSYEKIIELPVTNGLPHNIMEDDDQMAVDEMKDEDKSDITLLNTNKNSLHSPNIVLDNDRDLESPTFTQADTEFNFEETEMENNQPDCLLQEKTISEVQASNDIVINETKKVCDNEKTNDENNYNSFNGDIHSDVTEVLNSDNIETNDEGDEASDKDNSDKLGSEKFIENVDTSVVEKCTEKTEAEHIIKDDQIVDNVRSIEPDEIQGHVRDSNQIDSIESIDGQEKESDANILRNDAEFTQTELNPKKNFELKISDVKDDVDTKVLRSVVKNDSRPKQDDEAGTLIGDVSQHKMEIAEEKNDSKISNLIVKKTKTKTLAVRLEKMPLNVHVSNNVKLEIQEDDKEEHQLPIVEEKDDIQTETIPVQSDLVTDSSDAPKENCIQRSRESSPFIKVKDEIDPETASINSEASEISTASRKSRKNLKSIDKKFSKTNLENALENPEFIQYMEMREDAIIEENPELTHEDIVLYLYNTWIYEENLKGDREKADDIEQANLVKGLKTETSVPAKKIRKKKEKVEKREKEVPSSKILENETVKDKPKRKVNQPYYNEEYNDLDLENEIKLFEIFRKNKSQETKGYIKIEDIKQEPSTSTSNNIKSEAQESTHITDNTEQIYDVDEYDVVEDYFEQLIQPKPNVFKGLIREKVCEICETTGNLVRCKGCFGSFHVDCCKKELNIVEVIAPTRGRKKKKKPRGRKPKGYEENGADDSQSDEKDTHFNEENLDVSMEEEPIAHTVDAENFEAQLETKMKEILENTENVEYDSSDDEVTWVNTIPGKCEIVDVKLKIKQEPVVDINFKCNACEKNDIPLCFVCKLATSPKNSQANRLKCSITHCNKHFHLSCLEHWPQTQFNSGNTKTKQMNEHLETITCPRHVCHTCVSDDPRGCKTRFSGDKLAKCLKCPATYHTFTKCLPAGTQILTGSLIICPRHYQHRPGKVPCHVNTGWCFICALGGSLICCEYCPTSFHAECLNIDPPEGGYMCEDCETGRLPLYGEMVWVKLGHYRWWPGLILHPCEIPENIMAVKHSPGEFVVRFFGQYDHYWVNRGRVFPFQEGDSGKVSSQKSKIDEAFTMAVEHAHRAYDIIKSAQPNEEESSDIALSLMPPSYVKLRANKPLGALASLAWRRPEGGDSAQCDCVPALPAPCAPYSSCLNRMLLTECGPWCKSGDKCQNRAFEKRQYPKLTPYRTAYRGWGLKTLEDIKQGQFVIEYVGELIDEEEFRRRMTRKHEMRDENFYFLTLDKERMIDAGPKGNLARFMNHSCEPNCETQKWTVLGDVRVGLFALVDIPANSEVTFNYNLESAGIDKKRCMCGAKRCSGYMGAKPKQEEPQPKKNKIRQKRTYKKRKHLEASPSTSLVKKSPKPRQTMRSKPRELTDIEKDLLIIKNATNGISSDSESSDRLSVDAKEKALKRKRVSFSTEDSVYTSGTDSPSVKKAKIDFEKPSTSDVGD